MYDITKTRVLLTTAVFAAVAAVVAVGAHARIPEGDGSGTGVEPVAVVCSVVLCQPDEWFAVRLGFATPAGSAPTRRLTKFPDGYRGLP